MLKVVLVLFLMVKCDKDSEWWNVSRDVKVSVIIVVVMVIVVIARGL